MKILVFAASLRKDSLNKKLARLAAEEARKQGAEVDLAEFNEFAMPMYDGDMEERGEMPEGAKLLKARLDAAQGFILSSPEYNHSMPGTIKNAIDWTSRFRPMPWRGKTGLLLSASPGVVGGNRALWALRVPLELTGSLLVPDMFSLGEADEAFDDQGRLKDAKLAERLSKNVASFLKVVKALT